MPTPRRRLSPEVRRQELLDAAELLLQRHGSAVRVEDIVAEAGAAKGTFYVCFPSWDDLLEAIRERKEVAFQERVVPSLECVSPCEWETVLPDFAQSLIDFILSMGGVHEVLFHSAFTLARPPSPQKRPSTHIAALLRAGQLAGAYAPIDPEPTADLIFALIHETADAIAAGADRGRSLLALNVVLQRICTRG